MIGIDGKALLKLQASFDQQEQNRVEKIKDNSQEFSSDSVAYAANSVNGAFNVSYAL